MAPHLRNLRPPSTAVGLPHIPSHFSAKLPISRAPSNSSVPYCGLGQATELIKSQRQDNGINQPDNSTGLPVTNAQTLTCPSISTKLLSQFSTTPSYNST